MVILTKSPFSASAFSFTNLLLRASARLFQTFFSSVVDFSHPAIISRRQSLGSSLYLFFITSSSSFSISSSMPMSYHFNLAPKRNSLISLSRAAMFSYYLSCSSKKINGRGVGLASYPGSKIRAWCLLFAHALAFSLTSSIMTRYIKKKDTATSQYPGAYNFSSPMATKLLVCRLCRDTVSDKRMTHLFTRKSQERGWASRITALLDIPVSIDDKFPPHVCSKCIARIVTLEKASMELAAFKRSVQSAMEHTHLSLKRTKETSGEVGVSPDTLRERPRTKAARRLHFTSKSSSFHHTIAHY